MGGEVDYKDFYKFMHGNDMMKKFTNICCICQKDGSNVYYTTYSKGKKNLSNNSSYNYCFDKSFKRELKFVDEINHKGIDKLGDFLYNNENNCYHFYHENCKNKKIGCVFCHFGYNILNAHMFCKMREKDFTEVIKNYKNINKIARFKNFFDYYGHALINSAYSFIDKSNKFKEDAKDCYREKQKLENNLSKKCMIKYRYYGPIEEIALSEMDDWKIKLENKLAKEREEKESRKERMRDKDSDSDSDDQEV